MFQRLLFLVLLLQACNLAPSVRSVGTVGGDEVRVLCRESDSLLRRDVLEALDRASRARAAAARPGAPAAAGAMALLRIGRCYDWVRRWDEAIVFYRDALAATPPHNDSLRLDILTDMAEAFNKAGEVDSTLRYKLEALDAAARTHNMRQQVQLMNLIGGYYYDQGFTRKAVGWWQRCLVLQHPLHRPNAEAMICNNLAEGYLRLSEPDSALPLLRAGLALVRSTPDRGTESYLHLTLAGFYRKTDPDSSILYGRQAIQLAQTGGDAGVAEKAKSLVSDVYRENGQPVAALRYFQEYIATRDSAQAAARHDEEAWQVLRFDFDRSVNRLAVRQNELETESRRSRRWLQSAAAVLVLLCLLLLWLARSLGQNRRRAAIIRRQAEALQEQKEALQELVTEKELLIREVHHRVKNNLQVISGLLQLQANRSSDPGAREALEETQNRVLSIAFIHHNLYMHEGHGTVEIRSFVNELVEHLRAVFAGSETAIRLEVPPLELDIDTAVPLGLVVNELLTNSFKYAFGRGHAGEIVLALHTAGEQGHYELHYSDNGPGLPEGFEPEKASTLGLWLVRRLARQMGGSVSWSRPGKFEVRFRFKDAATRNQNDEHDPA